MENQSSNNQTEENLSTTTSSQQDEWAEMNMRIESASKKVIEALIGLTVEEANAVIQDCKMRLIPQNSIVNPIKYEKTKDI